jgi:hypothetical protein
VCLQRFFSATLQNFATQSLLMAVGVGARKALAASAAINWMLKDGMNRLVRMGVATQFGDSFDSDLKVGGFGLRVQRFELHGTMHMGSRVVFRSLLPTGECAAHATALHVLRIISRACVYIQHGAPLRAIAAGVLACCLHLCCLRACPCVACSASVS